MAESVKFKTNVPERVALKFADGLSVSSQFSGDQVMFTLTDDRKMYLPPVVADKIAAAGIRAGEAFSIVKAEVKTGNRRAIEYQIETAALENTAVTSSHNINNSALATPTPSVSYNGNAARAIHAVPAPAAPVAAAPAPAALADSAVAMMKMAGCGAIDVVLEVERYARSKGLTDFAFDPGSIQDLVTSLFISMERKAGRS